VTLINFILDIAALLLGLSWRSIPFDPLTRATPATLAGTVRRAEPPKLKRWHFLAVMFGLLLLRSVFYWEIGPAVNWTPRINLGIVAPAFPSNAFSASLLFSILSFIRTGMVFHFWLLALVMVNGHSTEWNPLQKLILVQLGWVGRWPRAAQAILPVAVTTVLWMAFHPLLAHVGIVKLAQSASHLLGQGALLGVWLYFSLKHLIPAFLFLHLVSNYVHMGNSPLWDYIGATSRKVLLPLNRLPLRMGRVDFAPLAGIILVLLLLHTLPNLVLTQLSRRNLVLWPQ